VGEPVAGLEGAAGRAAGRLGTAGGLARGRLGPDGWARGWLGAEGCARVRLGTAGRALGWLGAEGLVLGRLGADGRALGRVRAGVAPCEGGVDGRGVAFAPAPDGRVGRTIRASPPLGVDGEAVGRDGGGVRTGSLELGVSGRRCSVGRGAGGRSWGVARRGVAAGEADAAGSLKSATTRRGAARERMRGRKPSPGALAATA